MNETLILAVLVAIGAALVIVAWRLAQLLGLLRDTVIGLERRIAALENREGATGGPTPRP